jgi:hypothetical protein
MLDISGKNLVTISLWGHFTYNFALNVLIVRQITKQQLTSVISQPSNSKQSTKEYRNGYKQMVVLLLEECRNEHDISKKLNHLSNKFSR